MDPPTWSETLNLVDSQHYITMRWQFRINVLILPLCISYYSYEQLAYNWVKHHVRTIMTGRFIHQIMHTRLTMPWVRWVIIQLYKMNMGMIEMRVLLDAVQSITALECRPTIHGYPNLHIVTFVAEAHFSLISWQRLWEVCLVLS